MVGADLLFWENGMFSRWAQPPKAVSARPFRQTTSGAHGSAGRADCLPRGKPPACDIDGQFCRKKFPPGGLTRRLRRGWWGFRPEGGSTFFRSERKYQRKPAARQLRRRPAPLCVIRKYRRSGHCRARLLYLLRPASR